MSKLTLVPLAWLHRRRICDIFLMRLLTHTISCVAVYILQAVVRFFVLPLVRLYIETIGRAYRRVWYKMPHPLSIDGYHPLAHISLERAVRYGSGPAEVMDVLRPTADTAAAVGDAPGFEQVIVYLHGGGFVACNSEVLLHSLPCPLARAGFAVYSLDYPLAPENAFPAAPLSTIRALKHIKLTAGVTEVALVGDSAGGGLVSLVAGLLANPHLLERFGRQCGEDVHTWDLPSVTHMVSCYGVLSREGYSDKVRESTGRPHSETMDWFEHLSHGVLHFCVSCYLGAAADDMDPKQFMADFTPEELQQCPPSLLMCGVSDPLIHGARLLADRINAGPVDNGHGNSKSGVIFKEFPGHHAFLGFPIQWSFNSWQTNTWPAYNAMVDFITGVEGAAVLCCAPQWPRDIPFDWSVVVTVVVSLLVFPLYAPLILLYRLGLPLFYPVGLWSVMKTTSTYT